MMTVISVIMVESCGFLRSVTVNVITVHCPPAANYPKSNARGQPRYHTRP